MVPQRPIVTHLLSSAALSVSRILMKKYLQDHEKCGTPMVPILSSRALYVNEETKSGLRFHISSPQEVSEYATVTIAAANPSTATEDFLREIDPTPSIQSTLMMGQTVSRNWLVPQTDHNHNQGALAKRGWAFQEQILSSRLLHYGSKGLTWTCQSEKSKEVVPHYVNYALRSTIFPWHVQERKNSLQESVIAGVAAEFYKLHPDTYLARVWQGDLMRQLAWRRKLGTEGLQKRQAPSGMHEAPTCFRASQGNQIESRPLFKPDIYIHNVFCQAKNAHLAVCRCNWEQTCTFAAEDHPG